jgi:hypothetical protein
MTRLCCDLFYMSMKQDWNASSFWGPSNFLPYSIHISRCRSIGSFGVEDYNSKRSPTPTFAVITTKFWNVNILWTSRVTESSRNATRRMIHSIWCVYIVTTLCFFVHQLPVQQFSETPELVVILSSTTYIHTTSIHGPLASIQIQRVFIIFTD